jgi:sugar lactone lactonase YvrE
VWIDIWGPTIHRTNPATGKDDTWTAPEYLGTLSVREKGGLVVSMVSGFYFFDPATANSPPSSTRKLDNTRFNDGKTDRQGRFWSGSMFEAPGKTSAKIGSLWRLDADLSAHKVIDGVGCSNGLAWSPDSRTMYFTDSHTNLVWAYDFDAATGNAANRRVFIDLGKEGYIVDGSTVDADGCYWLTIPFNGKVRRYDPAGKLIQSIHLPSTCPPAASSAARTSTRSTYLGDAPPRPGHARGPDTRRGDSSPIRGLG